MTTVMRRHGLLSAAPARVDGRMLLGIALVAASIAGGVIFWGSTRQTTPILVAARELPAGHVIQPDDLGVTQARLQGKLASLAAADASRSSVVGRTLGTPVHIGAMVLWPDLTSGPVLGSADVALTLPVKPEAVYGGLRPGNAVAVLATQNKGQPDSRTLTVLQRAVIYAISSTPSQGVSNSSTDAGEPASQQLTNVTLIVPQSDAEYVTQALVNWDITLALLPAQSSTAQGSIP